MESDEEDKEYDPYDVDRTFVLSLFHGFSTVVPVDVRRQLASSEIDAVQFVMILRPRLTSFTHRQIISLRHPAVSMAARLYYNEQRATAQDEIRGDGRLGRSSIFSRSIVSSESIVERTRSRRMSWKPAASGGSKPITMAVLSRNNWELVGSCHDVILRNSQPRSIAVRAIATNDLVNDVICRYWERITVPPNDVHLNQNFDMGGNGVSRSMTVQDGDDGTYATRMTAPQYVYLHLRIADTLLPPSLLQAQVLDSIISDLHIDASLSQKSGRLSFGKAPEYYGHRSSDSGLEGSEHLELSGGDAPEAATEEDGVKSMDPLGAAVAAATAVQHTKSPFNAKAFETSSVDLPDISFGQFWKSMLELSDNWTSTSHPVEHAIFLMELYCEVFAHEWDDEDLAMMKSLRATAETHRQEDLFSVMDEEEIELYINSEFNHMIWSIAEFGVSGESYKPSIRLVRKRSSVTSPIPIDEEVSSSLGTTFGEKLMDRRKRASSFALSSSSSGIAGGMSKPDRHRGSRSQRRSYAEEEEGEKEGEKEGERRRSQRGKLTGEDAAYGRGRGRGGDEDVYEEEEEREGEGEGGSRRGKQRKDKGKRRRGERLDEGSDYRDEEYGDVLVGKGRKGKGDKGGGSDVTRGERRHKQDLAGKDGRRGSRRSSATSYISSERRRRRASGSSGKTRRHRRDSTGVFSDEEGEEGYITDENGVRRRRRGNRRGSRLGADRRDRQGRGRDGDEVSWSSETDSEASSFYSVPDSELTPKSLAQRQKEREERRQERLERRRERKERQLKALTLTAAELAEKRMEILNQLREKGIFIGVDELSDEDVLQLSGSFISDELMHRLMASAGYATTEKGESDFLHILFGDEPPTSINVSAEIHGGVLAALRAKGQRRPPETEYARRKREQQEKLMREKEKAAARKRREEHRRAREEANKVAAKSPPGSSESEESVFALTAPPQLPPSGKTPPPLPPGIEDDKDDDYLPTGLWVPTSRQEARRASWKNLPAHFRVISPDDPGLQVYPRHPVKEPESYHEYYNDGPLPAGLHEHSPAQFNLFYRDIDPHRPYKGPAPLAPPISILGGTFHQLPSIKLPSRGKGKQQRGALSPPPPPPPRQSPPVKLFSLTTKTSFAEALREELQRYIDDKEYLESISKSHLK